MGIGRWCAALLALVGCGTLDDFDRDGVVDVRDCAPEDPTRFPGAVESCTNGVDDDCDGNADGSDNDCGDDDDTADDDTGDDDTADDDTADDDTADDDTADDDTGDDDTSDDDTSDDDTSDDDSSDDDTGDDDDAVDPLAVDDDGDGWTELAGDCDDGDDAVHPTAAELCDGVDSDCDAGTPDPFDGDADGQLCDVDCDDADGGNFFGNVEVCDGRDNDCNGVPSATGEAVDADGDGSLACADCDDGDASRTPGAAELCDGADNDCDGAAPGEADGDADGAFACADCDDGSPGSTWIADDADCDGLLTAADCDDGDAASTAVVDDTDCDGVVDCTVAVTAGGHDFLPVCRGTFPFGCNDGTPECGTPSQPQRTVTLTRDFWLAQTEVTQAQWSTWVGVHPTWVECADCPAVNMRWADALAYANLLSAAEGLAECFDLSDCTGAVGAGISCNSVTVLSASGSVYDCEGYRLPTEAEFERAARASDGTTFAGSDDYTLVSWSNPNAGGVAQPVATLAPNGWGFYDLSGNAAEWCWDPVGFTPQTETVDPEGDPTQLFLRPQRGGDSISGTSYAAVWGRAVGSATNPASWVGFRLARTLP